MSTLSWSIDPTHSTVGFSVRHMMFSKVRGRFASYSATVGLDAGDLTRSKLTVEIDPASVDTGVADRDGHLKSPDFLDVAQFPTIRFVSSGVTKSDDGLALAGDLTIRGVTKPVTLAVEVLGEGKDPWGNARKLFSARGTLLRSDFGLTWNQALEAGGVLVSDKVEIEIEVQLVGKAG